MRIWLHKLISAAVSGGAGAVTSTFTASVIAPDKFNLDKEIWSFFKLALASFVVNGFLGMMLYLRQSPAPPIEGETEFLTKEGVKGETTETKV